MKIKKFLLIFLSLFFSVGLITISIFMVNQTRAQDQIKVKKKQTKKTSKVKVDYYLPYTGILPDHPLYWLKMIRDRILLILTRNPSIKFSRLLLYADKRLGAAKALIEGGKIQLGLTTVTKAEKYLEKAVGQSKELKKIKPGIKSKLTKAVEKHKEVLESLLENVSGQAKEVLKKEIEKTKNLNLNN